MCQSNVKKIIIQWKNVIALEVEFSTATSLISQVNEQKLNSTCKMHKVAFYLIIR
jgi:hypothetical protein